MTAGVIVVGGSPEDSIQYQLLRDQFGCISKYLGWDIRFHLSYFANGKEDLAGNAKALEELKAAGAAL